MNGGADKKQCELHFESETYHKYANLSHVLFLRCRNKSSCHDEVTRDEGGAVCVRMCAILAPTTERQICVRHHANLCGYTLLCKSCMLLYATLGHFSFPRCVSEHPQLRVTGQCSRISRLSNMFLHGSICQKSAHLVTQT